MTDLYWIHEDALRLNHPAAQKAGDNAHRFFIWDEAYLQEMDYGFHRLHFIYEALCDMGVIIYKGNIIDILQQLKLENNPQKIHVAASNNPRLKALFEQADSIAPLCITDEEPFVVMNKQPELKRFFKYWNKAQKIAFEINGGA